MINLTKKQRATTTATAAKITAKPYGEKSILATVAFIFIVIGLYPYL